MAQNNQPQKIKPVQLFVNKTPCTDEEIEAIFRENSARLDFQFFKFFRLLEHNEEFQIWLHELRAKAGIPADGYDWKENKILTGYKNVEEVDMKYYYDFEDSDLKYLLGMLRPGQKYKLRRLDWGDLITSNALRLPFGNKKTFYIYPEIY